MFEKKIPMKILMSYSNVIYPPPSLMQTHPYGLPSQLIQTQPLRVAFPTLYESVIWKVNPPGCLTPQPPTPNPINIIR